MARHSAIFVFLAWHGMASLSAQGIKIGLVSGEKRMFGKITDFTALWMILRHL